MLFATNPRRASALYGVNVIARATWFDQRNQAIYRITSELFLSVRVHGKGMARTRETRRQNWSLDDGKICGVGGHVGDVPHADLPDASREARFEALYTANYASIYAYVGRRLPSFEVGDVVAEVFAVAWRRLDQVPPAPEARLWLYGVARRCVARADRSFRRRGRLHARLSDEARARGSIDVGAESSRLEPVREAITRLRPSDREALQLVLWEGLTHAEAAQVAGCSVNALALRLHRARARLRTELAIDSALPSESVSNLEHRS